MLVPSFLVKCRYLAVPIIGHDYRPVSHRINRIWEVSIGGPANVAVIGYCGDNSCLLADESRL